MKENFEISDFELASDEIQQLRMLDTKESLFFSHYDPATVEMLVNLGK